MKETRGMQVTGQLYLDFVAMNVSFVARTADMSV